MSGSVVGAGGGALAFASALVSLMHQPGREPDLVLRGEGNHIYLRRWWLAPRNTQANLYLHEMITSDPGEHLHDHPWDSVSIVLEGSIVEIYEDEGGETRRRRLGPGDQIWRPAAFRHRLVVDAPARTLFATGPKIREWGFIGPSGWVHWEQYTATHPARAARAPDKMLRHAGPVKFSSRVCRK